MGHAPASLAQRDSLEALHPLPAAIARELATVPGLWVSSLVARFPEERPDLVRLAIATLLDTGVAWAPMPGRIALRRGLEVAS